MKVSGFLTYLRGLIPLILSFALFLITVGYWNVRASLDARISASYLQLNDATLRLIYASCFIPPEIPSPFDGLPNTDSPTR